MKPLAIDLYCGLGGWAEGFLAEGYTVIGFDIVRHDYGDGAYPGHLVIQDVLTLHGAQFKDAGVIIASPPCQEYSYRAMPWRRARTLPPPDNSLFYACFRIQREASEAAGRHIPLIVENVRGAQKWVGRARWHFGSYYLWGDVPALMPITKATKAPGQDWNRFRRIDEKSPPWRLEGLKTFAHVNARSGADHTRHLTNPAEHLRLEAIGVKSKSPGHYRKPGSGADWFDGGPAAHGSASIKRRAASAMLAKIPLPLAQHIARCFLVPG
jgi:hypothetical protein